MFRLAGLADEAGTGMPKIIRAWRELGFQLPTIDVGTERYEFCLELRHAHLLSEDDRVWLRALGEHWTEAEQLALVIARHEDYVDNRRLRNLTDQHAADVTKVLVGLRDAGFLEMIGGKRGARYQLRPAALAGAAGRGGVAHALPAGPTSAVSPVGIADDGELDSGDVVADSEGVQPNSEGLTADSERSWTELLAIAAPARGTRKLAPAVLEELVISLCAHGPLALTDLANLLERSDDYLRTTLRRLVNSRRIVYLYPDQPKHPRQKYKLTPPAAMEPEPGVTSVSDGQAR